MTDQINELINKMTQAVADVPVHGMPMEDCRLVAMAAASALLKNWPLYEDGFHFHRLDVQHCIEDLQKDETDILTEDLIKRAYEHAQEQGKRIAEWCSAGNPLWWAVEITNRPDCSVINEIIEGHTHALPKNNNKSIKKSIKRVSGLIGNHDEILSAPDSIFHVE